MPDAARFTVPFAFTVALSHDVRDTDGEIDIVIVDIAAPFLSLPDGVVVEITFAITCGADSIGATTPVWFLQRPASVLLRFSRRAMAGPNHRRICAKATAGRGRRVDGYSKPNTDSASSDAVLVHSPRDTRGVRAGGSFPYRSTPTAGRYRA